MPDNGVKKKDCEAVDTDYQDKEETLMKNAGVLEMILGDFQMKGTRLSQNQLELRANSQSNMQVYSIPPRTIKVFEALGAIQGTDIIESALAKFYVGRSIKDDPSADAVEVAVPKKHTFDVQFHQTVKFDFGTCMQ